MDLLSLFLGCTLVFGSIFIEKKIDSIQKKNRKKLLEEKKFMDSKEYKEAENLLYSKFPIIKDI